MQQQYSPPPVAAEVRPRQRFRPGWLPSLAVLLLLPLLIGLGAWQLSRAEEKRALLAAQDALRASAPLTIAQVESHPQPAFQPVQLHGRFDASHSLLLDSRIRQGQVGVELLQPFYDQASGLWLLINRGWLPWPDRRVPVAFDTPEQVLSLTGWVYQPPGESFQLSAASGRDWPRLINRVEPAALWAELGRAGWPHEIRLSPGMAAYAVDWPVVAMSPEQHLGYAVQWFALALALLILYLYLGLRRAKESADVERALP